MNRYNRLCTQFYDIDKPNAPEDALAFYLQYAVQANGPILEPMCGSGRFLIPLLANGFDIDGTDASPHMLQACRKHAEHRGLTPTLYQQLLHQMDLPREYALVIIPVGSFCLLTDPEHVRESLRRIYEQMLPEARFVLEIEQYRSQPSSSWPWGGRWVRRPDGATILISWLGHFDAETRTSSDIHRYELVDRDGRLLDTEFEDFNLRFYDCDEFRALLEAAGFTDFRMFKTYAREAPNETDESFVVECAKP